MHSKKLPRSMLFMTRRSYRSRSSVKAFAVMRSACSVKVIPAVVLSAGCGLQPGARGRRDCAPTVAREPPHSADAALQHRRLEVFLILEKGGFRGNLLRQILHVIER